MIIKPVAEFERELVRDFYLALPEDDRAMRFCANVSAAVVDRYVEGLDFTGRTILAAYSEKAEMIALAELAPVGDKGELAFAVQANMRRQGVGTRLMERLLGRARMCGLREAFVMFLWENAPMRRLAVRAGMAITCEGSEGYGRRLLERPNGAELARWCVEDIASHGEHFATSMIARGGSLIIGAPKSWPWSYLKPAERPRV